MVVIYGEYMNKDKLEGMWENLKGRIQETWGELTDDDLDIIAGKRKQLAGKLQEKYGYVSEKAEAEIERFLSSCGEGACCEENNSSNSKGMSCN